MLLSPCMIQNIYCRPDPSSQFRLAIGSYVDRYSNRVQIVKKRNTCAKDSSNSNPNYNTSLYKAAEFDHHYPCTKILWSPDVRSGSRDLVAPSEDYLRLWNLTDDGSGEGALNARKEAVLNYVRESFSMRSAEAELCF